MNCVIFLCSCFLCGCEEGLCRISASRLLHCRIRQRFHQNMLVLRDLELGEKAELVYKQNMKCGAMDTSAIPTRHGMDPASIGGFLFQDFKLLNTTGRIACLLQDYCSLQVKAALIWEGCFHKWGSCCFYCPCFSMDNTFQLVLKFLESLGLLLAVRLLFCRSGLAFMAFPCLNLWRLRRLTNSPVRCICIQFVFEEMEVQSMKG